MSATEKVLGKSESEVVLVDSATNHTAIVLGSSRNKCSNGNDFYVANTVALHFSYLITNCIMKPSSAIFPPLA